MLGSTNKARRLIAVLVRYGVVNGTAPVQSSLISVKGLGGPGPSRFGAPSRKARDFRQTIPVNALNRKWLVLLSAPINLVDLPDTGRCRR